MDRYDSNSDEEPPSGRELSRLVSSSPINFPNVKPKNRNRAIDVGRAADDRSSIVATGTDLVPVRMIASQGRGKVVRLRTTARTSPRTVEFRRRYFPNVTEREWRDWRWQSRNRFKTLAHFERVLELSSDERDAMSRGGMMLPTGVTPYYMSLLDPADPNQALRRTVIPTTNEFLRFPGEADDPLGEDAHSPVPGLVHRYPDRVLLLALDFCSTYCRYCTRSRVVGHGEISPNGRLEAIFQYLEQATEVRDVLISGGDPLALGEDKLDWILGRLRAIPHIEFIRIGTLSLIHI